MRNIMLSKTLFFFFCMNVFFFAPCAQRRMRLLSVIYIAHLPYLGEACASASWISKTTKPGCFPRQEPETSFQLFPGGWRERGYTLAKLEQMTFYRLLANIKEWGMENLRTTLGDDPWPMIPDSWPLTRDPWLPKWRLRRQTRNPLNVTSTMPLHAWTSISNRI